MLALPAQTASHLWQWTRPKRRRWPMGFSASQPLTVAGIWYPRQSMGSGAISTRSGTRRALVSTWSSRTGERGEVQYTPLWQGGAHDEV